MNINEIKELLREVKNLNIKELQYKNNGIELSVINDLESRSDGQLNLNDLTDKENISTQTVEVFESNFEYVVSPIVGVFYQSPSPNDTPYVSKNKVIKKGEILCIIEAMKVMNEIIAEYDMKIIDTNVKDGQLVEFNQNLFTVEKV